MVRIPISGPVTQPIESTTFRGPYAPTGAAADATAAEAVKTQLSSASVGAETGTAHSGFALGTRRVASAPANGIGSSPPSSNPTRPLAGLLPDGHVVENNTRVPWHCENRFV